MTVTSESEESSTMVWASSSSASESVQVPLAALEVWVGFLAGLPLPFTAAVEEAVAANLRLPPSF
jgi:hypothetical protein